MDATSDGSEKSWNNGVAKEHTVMENSSEAKFQCEEVEHVQMHDQNNLCEEAKDVQMHGQNNLCEDSKAGRHEGKATEETEKDVQMLNKMEYSFDVNALCEKDKDVQMQEQCEDAKVGAFEMKNITEESEGQELRISEEDSGSSSYNGLDDDSDDESSSTSKEGDANSELPLTDSDIQELISEFLEVESKAAEAQESLEKESLARVESDVRAELSENLHGDELEKAVSTEMEVYTAEWCDVLDDLETQSSLLLEQLDGAGVELPKLYKLIESEAPNVCCSEAWKKRAFWVGSQITTEVDKSVKDAEEYLQSCRPVRRKHGRLLEEGASGFLAGKIANEESEKNKIDNVDSGWHSFNEILQSHRESEGTGFGSKHWASVYLASTPKQAANMGLKCPGVDEVEEIGEIKCDYNDPFFADALANEGEIDLSEAQKRNFRKVKEEDDLCDTRKLQRHLKRRRQKMKVNKESVEKDVLTAAVTFDDSLHQSSGKLSSSVNDEEAANIIEGTRKRSRDCDIESETERCQTVLINSDDEVQILDNDSVAHISQVSHRKDAGAMRVQEVDVIDVDGLPSLNPEVAGFEKTKTCDSVHCTACSELLKASEVISHPLLKVIICPTCKLRVEEKLLLKDSTSLSNYCQWCGRCEDLLCCSSCETYFCSACIHRNFGDECLSEARSGWKCCCCLPVLLQKFISECEDALEGGMSSSYGSGSDFSDAGSGVKVRRRRKRRIRRILDDTELREETKEKIAIEKARQEHLKSMQAQSASKSFHKNALQSVFSTTEVVTASVLGDATEGYIVNVAREENEEPVRIPPSISSRLKPHQVSGIRFMWENIIQSVRRAKSGDKGLGCILAHTMGLGKTFQVIAFLYIAMRHVDLGLRTALVVTPVNVLHNWRQEFLKWRPTELKPLRVFMLEDVARDRRAFLLAKWRVKGGVLLIGYATFRNLSLRKHVKDRNTAFEMCHALQYGPDVLVCDEAHMIKNTRADITQALKQVKTQRRIALTGSPLQNNLMEYYCMVDFVREGFLGSSHEFRNRFQNPIENGQHTNSTSDDVKIMNQRSHILYEQLKGFVQRMDMNVVKKDLPPKTVFVITVKLSLLQRKLYKKFLDVHGFTSDRVSSDRSFRQRCFFTGYQALAQVWNHPGLVQLAKEHKDNIRREDAVENFLVDDGSSDDNLELNDFTNGERQRARNDYMPKKNDGVCSQEDMDWWEDVLNEKSYKEIEYSGKMVLLLDILSMSYEVGDKTLVFSQSLTTLDLIELYLSKVPRKGSEGKFWKQGKDWYRLDGRTDGSERQKLVERFNEPSNTRVKCTLISTRAGSLGINLHAANRVVIVDGSWNPTNDLQAIFRAWRYGQKKPVYAYRLLAHATMEEKIYKRQVTKEGLAARVVDRQQIHRTMSKEEMLHLFEFGDDELSEGIGPNPEKAPSSSNAQSPSRTEGGSQHKSLAHSLGTSTDRFMASLVERHYPRWITAYHEHESLLQENEDERLSKEEQEMAWTNYQRSLEREEVHRTYIDDSVPSERKPVVNVAAPSAAPSEGNAPQQVKGGGSSRSRPAHPRKCTNLAHLLTLRSQGTKSGSSTVCRECSQEISWENLNRDGKTR